MDPEIKRRLDSISDTLRENNQILHKMYRKAKMATVLRLFYWLAIIGFSFGAYYLVEPYVNQVMSVYSGFQTDLGAIQKWKDSIVNFGN